MTELASHKYNDSQLLELSQFNRTIYELNKKYPIECIRKINNNLRISYLGDSSIAILIFDNDGNKILGNVYSTLLSTADYNNLAIGQSLDNVIDIDSNGEYLFLYTGRNDTPRISTHYTKDGYIITIEYDDKNTITNIKKALI